MKRLHLCRGGVVLGLVSLVLLVSVPAAAQSGTGDWLHYGYDGAYTSYNAVESTINVENVAQLEQQWGIGCDDGYFSVISRSPAIYDGTLFTSGAGSNLTAYNAVSGEVLWQYGQGNMAWAPQPVVSEDGVVFYMEGSDPTNLYAVDSHAGSLLWEAPLAFEMGFNDVALATVDEANGLVYVVENRFSPTEGKLFALDKQTGEVVWYKSEAKDNIAFIGDYVLLGDGKLFAAGTVLDGQARQDHMLRIDMASQAIDITFDRPGGYHEIKQYTLCNDTLIAGYDYQYEPEKLLIAYDTSSPAIVWQKGVSEITGTIACNPDTNRVYVPTDPYLYALDAATGEEIWTYTGFGPIYNPSVANGIVYFISDTNMYAINEETGEKLFRYPLGNEGYETTQVAISNGMVYFSGNGGTCDLYALGLPE